MNGMPPVNGAFCSDFSINIPHTKRTCRTNELETFIGVSIRFLHEWLIARIVLFTREDSQCHR